RQRYPSVGHVVIREDGGPGDLRNFRNRRFRSAVRASVGDPMRLHDLRHTHVGLLIAEGAHAKVIADRLGDTVTTTLSVYGHLLEGVGDDAVDRLGRGGVSPNDPQASAEGG